MYRIPIAQSADPALRVEALKAAKSRVEPRFWSVLGLDPALAAPHTVMAINGDGHGYYAALHPEGLSALQDIDRLLELERAGAVESHQVFYWWVSKGDYEFEKESTRRIFEREKTKQNDRGFLKSCGINPDGD